MNAPNQSGISMVEITISIALGLILISSFVDVIANIKNTSRLNHQNIELQENALFLFHDLFEKTRQTNIHHCIEIGDTKIDIPSTKNKSKNNFLITTSVAGIDDYHSNNIENYSDKLSLQWLEYIAPVNAPQSSTNDYIEITANGNEYIVDQIEKLSKGDILLISNCRQTDIFTLTNIIRVNDINGNTSKLYHDTKNASGTVVNDSNSLQTTYDNNATIYKINTTHYFSQPDKNNINAHNISINTLFRQQNGNTQAFISHVDFFRVLYAESNEQDNVPDQFTNASNIKNWNNIRAIKVAVAIAHTAAEDNTTRFILDKEYSGSTATSYVLETIFAINQ